MGKIKNLEKFDGLFFEYLATLSDEIDPEARILLETAYEAIVDAGQSIKYEIKIQLKYN